MVNFEAKFIGGFFFFFDLRLKVSLRREQRPEINGRKMGDY